MNAWAAPLALIVALIFGVLLFLTQDHTKKVDPELPAEAGTFQPISLSPAQGQTQGANAKQQQAVEPTFGVEEGIKASYSATIRTTKGTIKVTLRGDAAPNTVKNFISKAKSGFYKNLTFHRVENWVIQGGDPKGDGTGGNLVKTEVNSVPFVTGSLGVAGVKHESGAIISNDAQFFITKEASPHLNGQYTNFGEVTEGMNVVQTMKVGDKILGITVEGL